MGGEFLLRHSGLRIHLQWLSSGCWGGAKATPSLVQWVKDLALLQLWRRSQPRLGFTSWPVNFRMLWVQPSKNKNKKVLKVRISRCSAVETNPTRNHEVVGSIPGLPQWAMLHIAVSCGIGCRHGSDPASLWLRCRSEATALIWALADVALEKDKKEKHVIENIPLSRKKCLTRYRCLCTVIVYWKTITM